VLAGAGFGDDPLRADAFREQRLADGVVDLVRAGVREIFTLQVHLRAPTLRDSRHEGERRGPPDERLQLMREGGFEFRAVQMLANTGFQPLERRNEHFRHVAAAERAEAAALVRKFSRQLVGEQMPGIDLMGTGVHDRVSFARNGAD
jgi:hypothetical protein